MLAIAAVGVGVAAVAGECKILTLKKNNMAYLEKKERRKSMEVYFILSWCQYLAAYY